MKKIIFMCALAIGVMSCSERGDNIDLLQKNSVKNDKSYFAKSENPKAVVASFTFNFASRKKGCESGIGICELVAFGIKIVTLPAQPQAAVVEETNSAGKFYYAQYELPEQLGDIEDASFYVEEDIHTEDEYSNRYIIKAGNYEYDETIGEFGGYKIEMEKI